MFILPTHTHFFLKQAVMDDEKYIFNNTGIQKNMGASEILVWIQS